ncbi:hypothetical protein [Aliiglaciecola litoralis]|uniref:Rap1a immunity protein domain-containing protein n=1 Tax=Aliiglaciecola litoralis TaxID=582857 RepID=A0ABN1LUH5_9ALTE
MKVFIIFLIFISTVSNAEEVKKVEGEKIGYSCFKEPSWPNDKNISYLCVFELNTVSPFYDDDKRNKIVKNFVGSIKKDCKVSEGIEMVEANSVADHGMFLMAYHVSCK